MTVDVPDDVRAALAQVDRLPALPVSVHVAVFEEVHRLLDGVLADLDGLAAASPRPDAAPPGRTPA
ncbi:hypothetical protein [Protofrankia symbiont of Coriaria ruscifolia]|uniref:Uncharacterized protein n=1 Tax=Candidatus Protofrankia californiensis TaxID=1839754 RepID=A0A1C3P902_9ACTN|nr:hypothetical protein [Protofrankia symbiont of Coriaria ruscifolia]SBW26315.1 hypothetical protein FDG2_4852 [Candidatus Protofrankia californiensis]